MLWLILLLLIGIIYFVYNQQKNRIRTNANSDKQYEHAIIMGGSISGMTTAAYLSKYFKRITIIEPDDVLNETLMNCTADELLDYRCNLKNSNTLGRSGTSQSYQIHVLQGEGGKILFDLFPNLKSRLINEHGAKVVSLKENFRFVIGDVMLNKNLTEDLGFVSIVLH